MSFSSKSSLNIIGRSAITVSDAEILNLNIGNNIIPNFDGISDIGTS